MRQNNKLRLAFYKGTKKGISGVYNKGVRMIENGRYSHVEAVFSSGISASASFMDGGVRFKEIDYLKHPEDWDIVEIPWVVEKEVLRFFTKEISCGYDILGNVHFVFGFIGHSDDKWFCSEIVAAALGLNQAWQYAPNQLYEVVVFINKQFERQQMLNLAIDDDSNDDETGSGNTPDKPKKPPVAPVGG